MYVVTGGAGFIGSNIVAALEARGITDIVVVDRLRSNEKWRNLAKRELADIVAPENLFQYLDANASAIKCIFHMGAISATTEKDADLIITNNFRLSLALWVWCTANHVRLIYASSAATYGDGEAGFNDDSTPEGLAHLHPMNAYGWSKHLFDRRVARLMHNPKACPPQWVGLKFFNVYGPNEHHKGGQKSVVAQIFPQAEGGNPAHLFRSHNPKYPDGGQLRDFVYIDDCVDVMMWLLDNPHVSGLYNLGTGQARSFLDLASSVYRALGKEPYIKYIDTPAEIRSKYQYFTEARMARLRAAGYVRSFTSLEDGVTRYVQKYLASPDPYK
ncbi:MAG: ADP-glyceromanno-heptose 6-epimerase [Alphaproteobacteria bacterium]|nr:ADP-glyceromanno-heptose 6-epimerase [Alphaproteobacteria bacterium]